MEYDIDALVQGRSIPIADALEILQSCTKPSIWSVLKNCHWWTLHSFLYKKFSGIIYIWPDFLDEQCYIRPGIMYSYVEVCA